MDCPVCFYPMMVVERDDIELDFCPQCKGIWFDEGELELLYQKHEIEHNLPDLFSRPSAVIQEKKRPCPRCRKKMDKISLEGGLVLDCCPQSHGLWFDSGELGQYFSLEQEKEEGKEGKMISFLGETFSAGK